MKVLFASVILIATASLISSCHKISENDHKNVDTTYLFPKYRTVDKSQFSCKVNGVEFVPKTMVGDFMSLQYYPTNLTWNRGQFKITAYYKIDSIFRVVSFGVYPITSSREYLLAPADSPSLNFGEAIYGGIFSTNKLYTGKVSFSTYDSSGGRIAGTFSFVAYDSTQHKKITITDGVFDLKR